MHMLQAAIQTIGHDLLYLSKGKIHLDETEEPVSVEMQKQIEELAEKLSIKTLEERQAEALTSLDQEHAEILRNLTGNATIEERDTWQSKALAAEAIQAGNANPYQLDMIGTEASLSGVEVAELVTTILTKNAGFMKMIGLAAGHRAATREAIKSAPDTSTLDLILTKAGETAQTLITNYLKSIGAG